MRNLESVLRSITLKQLGYFVRIVEMGSITKAAETLHIAQPALGLQIRQLEQELHASLLTRHSRGVRPTEAGSILYDRAVQVLLSVDSLRYDIENLGGQKSETISLGLTPSIMAAIGPEIIVRAREEIGDLNIVLFEELSVTLLDLIGRNELDIALAYEVVDSSAAVRRTLLEEELVLVSRSDSSISNELKFLEILDLNLILSPAPDSMRRVIEKSANDLSVAVTATYEVRSIAAMKALIARGLGVALLPFVTVAHEVATGTLRSHHIVEPQLIRTLDIITPVNRPPLKHEARLIGLVVDTIQETVRNSEGRMRFISS